ncbi:unnamed protein product [Calicophoron daubneyi]|uniref:Uncharacterized protein n=1 Tax=Calicophoron daubneyi TaxID=300641 RepID=A0AAV2SXW7_CALDB
MANGVRMSTLKGVILHRSTYGYGFTIRSEHPCEIDFVAPCSSADDAGLHSGDVVLAVNDVDVSSTPHEDVAALIRQSGSVVILKLLPASFVTPPNRVVDGHMQKLMNDNGPPQSPLFAEQVKNPLHKTSAAMACVGKFHFSMDSYHVSRLPVKEIPLLVKRNERILSTIKEDAVYLFEVFNDFLRFRSVSSTFEYSPSFLLGVGCVENDRRYFFLIVRSRNTLNGKMQSYTQNAATTYSNSAFCWLFRCVPPSLLAHRSHENISNNLSFCCHRDRFTGDCREFPRSTFRLVTFISELLRSSSGSAAETTPLVPHFSRFCRASCSTLQNPTRLPDTFHSTSSAVSSFAPFTPHVSTGGSTVSFEKKSNKPSVGRVFGKFARAAGFLRDRWLDKRTFVQEFLSLEFSTENLDFWCVVQDWRNQCSHPDAAERAKDIFNTFLDPSSSYAVNVDDHAVHLARGRLSHPSADMFSEAELQVYQLMKNDSYPRFLKSSIFLDLLRSDTTEKENKPPSENSCSREIRASKPIRRCIQESRSNFKSSIPDVTLATTKTAFPRQPLTEDGAFKIPCPPANASMHSSLKPKDLNKQASGSSANTLAFYGRM